MQKEPLKILIVENDAAFSHAIEGMLKQMHETPTSVVTIRSVNEALGKLQTSAFDVIILEFFLADGAGLANVPLLKEKSIRIPIIVVGSADDECIAVESVQSGAEDYLIKSQLNPRWLLRSIRYAMERHRADMALLDAQENYRGIFNHLVEGIFQTTPEGRYLMANLALARIYGYNTPEELMQSVTDIAARLYVKAERRAEFKRIMDEQDTITGFESQIFRKDGAVIWISENCRAVRDADGKLLYYEGTVEDITQRLNAEQELRNSESLYHSLVETMPQNVFRKDLQGRFTFANQQYCDHYRCKLSDILGKTDFDFFPKELAEKYQRDDQRVIETGKTYEIVEEHQPLGQDKTYIQVVKTPLFGPNGKIIGTQGIFWDITAQKLAEEQIRLTNAELALKQAELRVKNAQMEDDLKMAAEIQITMLPQQYPTVPRSASPAESVFQFNHRYLPSGTVGGDFFSVSALSDSEVGVFICDVAGHGVRSALVTAMIRALVEELKFLAGDPGEFLTKLNSDLFSILKHTGTPVLTTAFYLTANARTGSMRYASAGHPKPLHLRRSVGKVETLKIASKQTQPALGLFNNAKYQTSTVTLAPHDLIVLYTDGLYEVESSDNQIYNQEILAGAVQKRMALPPAQLFDELLEEIRSFAADHVFDDDVCIVGVEFNKT